VREREREKMNDRRNMTKRGREQEDKEEK